MLDSWWQFNVEVRDYIYYSAHHNSYSRLDNIFVTQNINSNLVSACIEPRIFSDHAAVSIRWRCQKGFFGKPRWQLDNFILWEKAFRTQIESEVKTFFEANTDTADDTIVREAFKAYMRGILISIKSYVVKQYNKACAETLKEISIFEAWHKVNVGNYLFRITG